MERLKAMAEAEDRPLASVVRRQLTSTLVPNVLPPPRREPLTDVADAIGRKEFTGDLRTGRPIGGQDAASGAGVEARQEGRDYQSGDAVHGPDAEAMVVDEVAEFGPVQFDKVLSHAQRRERVRCDPGRHPVGSKIGRACGACGQEDAWTK